MLTTRLLAVYGTLRTEHPVKLVRLTGWKMYSAGWFPAVVPDPLSSVVVELLDYSHLSEREWALKLSSLDSYEGVPTLYTREEVQVDEDTTAFMYVWALPVSDLPVVAGGDWQERQQ